MPIQRRTNEPKPIDRLQPFLMGAGFFVGTVLFVVPMFLAHYSRSPQAPFQATQPRAAQPLAKPEAMIGDPVQKPARPANSWAPQGYIEYTDKVALSIVSTVGNERCYLDHCYAIMAIAKDGCPNSLYVKLILLDENGVNVGYTNDLTSGLRAGEQAELVFNTTKGSDYRIDEVNCR